VATGLFYDFQRWYDPSIGRFISEDPLAGISDPSSLNAYIYVEDSPTAYADPTGMGAVAVVSTSHCPAVWEGSFWNNPLGSIACDFGIGGTVQGGGEGGVGTSGGVGGPRTGISPNAAGAAFFLILWGIWGIDWLYSHWDRITGDKGGGTTPPSDNNGNGRTKTGDLGGNVRVPSSDGSTLGLGGGTPLDGRGFTSSLGSTGALTNVKWVPTPLTNIGVRGTKALACTGLALAATASWVIWSLPSAAEQRNYPRANHGTGVDLSPYVWLGTFLACGFVARYIG